MLNWSWKDGLRNSPHVSEPYEVVRTVEFSYVHPRREDVGDVRLRVHAVRILGAAEEEYTCHIDALVDVSATLAN